MKVLHLVPEISEANGVCRVARLLAAQDGGAVLSVQANYDDSLSGADEVWVHGMWLPREWIACAKALKTGKRLVRMPHGSLSPVYLQLQSKWKKRLVSVIERFLFRRASTVVVTGAYERDWCERWKIRGPFEVVDIKRFFRLPEEIPLPRAEGRRLRVLYLGMKHRLKGVEFLAAACRTFPVDLRMESSVFGEEKDSAFAWSDLLCLPTLSENFGLVVAEALEHGKRVVTTDGAPAWSDLRSGQGIFLRGYCEGTSARRIDLLRNAIQSFINLTGAIGAKTGEQ